ncbi:polysaccharide biosynthesis tyrosine autokinase [Gramella sp. AN32]|uniref:non-specific protein-tyrosine kinase n=1 Tax=Christiangramia antarctica TaxID=2058158 RepID=A0ABW5X2V4_9FLAO|nr:polysaccharide biosynthesis tyrosine autokinase [Gramella sp. AN32]MCM4157095.1 tyrosine protein kinase [Gramella sp. AN32]
MEEFSEDFNEPKEESNFDLKAEIFKYLTYWKWLFLGFLVGGCIAFLYNRYTIPVFRTESNLLITKSEENNMSGILPSSGTGSIIRLESNSLQNQIVTLKSKNLVKKVVDSLNLNISYFIEGNVITTEAYKSSPVTINFITPDSIVNNHSKTFIIFPKSNRNFEIFDKKTEKSWKYDLGELISIDSLDFIINSSKPDQFRSSNPIYIEIKPVDRVAANFISKLEVGPKAQSGEILLIGLTYSTSKKAEDFLNNLMYQFNAEGVNDKRQVAGRTTQFIDERLHDLSFSLDTVETNIADFKRDNEFMDVASGAQQLLSRKTEAEQRIFEIETQLNIINSIKNLLANSETFDLLPGNMVTGASQVQNLIEQYNQLILERNSLLRTSTEQNPMMEALDAQIIKLKPNLIKSIEAYASNLRIEISDLNIKESTAKNRFSDFPKMEKGMRGIERKQTIFEQLYLFLLQRKEEAAIAFASTSDVAKVIEPAFTYGSPVSPSPLLILIGGFILGLLIPLLIIFLKNLLDTKVHHKGDLQTLLSTTPFMGEVPRIDTDESDVIQLNDRSSLAESFRILRTNLAYLIQNKDKERGDVIFVTSTIKGEGKTFVSYNLSRTLASTNKRVLLIGADIRNPKLHRYTQMTKGAVEKGLSDYLYDHEIPFDKVISKIKEDEILVDVILSGPIPPNPAELLMNDRMESLINKAKTLYDYIIVDTAPTMIVTDTLLISQLADYTLYVARADYTEKSILQFPKDMKKQGKLKGLAVILNDVDYSKFSYGAKYGYSYGYGYGYGQDAETRWERWKRRLSRN